MKKKKFTSFFFSDLLPGDLIIAPGGGGQIVLSNVTAFDGERKCWSGYRITLMRLWSATKISPFESFHYTNEDFLDGRIYRLVRPQ